MVVVSPTTRNSSLAFEFNPQAMFLHQRAIFLWVYGLEQSRTGDLRCPGNRWSEWHCSKSQQSTRLTLARALSSPERLRGQGLTVLLFS